MDIVTDLTAEAVSFLSVFQDICKDQAKPGESHSTSPPHLWEMKIKSIEKNKCSLIQKQRIKEIIFCSSEDPGNSEDINDKTVNCFYDITKQLLSWLKLNTRLVTEPGRNVGEANKKATLLSTPYEWRGIIREILYEFPNKRAELTKILHYMPIQVILCLGGQSANAYRQRLYQIWEPSAKKDLVLLNGKDEEVSVNWWGGEFQGEIRSVQALQLLKSDIKLLKELKDLNNPVPFETFFNRELDEIERSREKRTTDPCNRELEFLHFNEPTEDKTQDPVERAKRMNLIGVAFSGGGIRSATFNLGVLQILAEKNILPRVDYLSTVSGGGYIGSWLTSWIKRAGSVSKVSDRLNTTKSADPMADEVLPVRWLRMFSNYLNPDASIMSLDSWTVGITWLRNTLINQIILLLLLCSFLSFADFLFSSWKYLAVIPFGNYGSQVIWWSSGILIIGCILSGLGMRMYDQSNSRWQVLNWGKYKFLSVFLISWAILTAFLISNWIFLNTNECREFNYFTGSLKASIFVCISLIAFLGNYHTYPISKWGKRLIVPLILFSSYLASLACIYLLKTAESIFLYVRYHAIAGRYTSMDSSELLFIIGVPLILEVISITVIVRMIIMGNMFPDERREWWGRMGANVHRFIMIWIMITSCVLLLPKAFNDLSQRVVEHYDEIPALIGGWAVIIGYAVNLAFNSSSSPKDKKNNKVWSFKDTFVRFAPYLFIVGFLLIATVLHQLLKEYINRFPLFDFFDDHKILTCLLNTLLMLGVTLLLSWRVGVNEFSLHHFYRNRLVRAYLGATRRRVDRGKTANNFTGFDKLDDMKLAKLRVKYDYFGPFPLINTTLNASVVADLDRQDRKAESFVFTPMYSGFDISPTRSASYSQNRVYDYGYRPTGEYAYEEGPNLGTAMAISGAAVNPNQGHHSSAATAFLLTVFNVRLGWWIGNPRLDCWQRSDPATGIAYIIKDLIGSSDIDSDYVCLSDGGHFDNMGLYELIRRRCAYIILGDAEQDTGTLCEGLANAIRRCWIDFGVEISTTEPLVNDADGIAIIPHITKYTIRYAGDTAATGTLIYIKSALSGDESTDIREYQMQNPQFPQQSTSDQFFDEAQFESYRKLGYHSLENFKFDLPPMMSGN